MIKAEEYWRNKDSSYIDVIKELAKANNKHTWEECYWAAIYLNDCSLNNDCFDLCITLLEHAFFKGLTYDINKEYYLEGTKTLGRLYLETQQYELAVNQLQDLTLVLGDTTPDWVWLRFMYAQLHSDTALMYVKRPKSLFDNLDHIDKRNQASVSQRNAVFFEFLSLCTDNIDYLNSDGDFEVIKAKTKDYCLEQTEQWKSFLLVSGHTTELPVEDANSVSSSNFICDESESEGGHTTFDNLSNDLIANLRLKNEELQNKISSLESQMEQLLSQNKSYEHLLEERNSLIQQMTENGFSIDSINRNKSVYGEGGHALLQGRKKILVIGASMVGSDKLLGVAKGYGYEKDDFVFWDEYEKIKSYAERLEGASFSGIIAGPMPHKVSNLGESTSLIDRMKQPGYPHLEEARCEGGELKITKTSFRKALEKITQHLLAIQ